MNFEIYKSSLRCSSVFRVMLQIASNRFSSDIVETLPIYYFMRLEYMSENSKLLTIRNARKLSVKKN